MDNKMLLMQCAKELFYAKGYDAVSVQEIVDRAGLTKPTLYYYFESKLGLLRTLLDTKTKDFSIHVYEIVGTECSIREALYRLAMAYRGFFEQDREFYMLLMSLFYSARENEVYQVVKPVMSRFYEKVVEIFDNASGQLGNMHGRQWQFAIGFIGTVNQFFLFVCEKDPGHQSEISEAQMVSLVNQFMYGIFS